MNNNLTDNKFWQNFWESKKNLIFKINPDYTFHKLLESLIKERKLKSAIELGGFPGYYTIFLKKYFNLNTTLFDYYIFPPIINELLNCNDLKIEDVSIIEADLFTYQPESTYDLVTSFGLIEHFEDTHDIINRHLPFLKEGGTLFITLPNFKGVNGWIQQVFDRYNYNKHNINCMDPMLLETVAQELGLNDVQAYYYGNFSTWLEHRDEKSVWAKVITKLIWYAGKGITRAFRFESKLLSPYIVLEAKK